MDHRNSIMEKYIINEEFSELHTDSAGGKARNDILHIAENNGIRRIDVPLFDCVSDNHSLGNRLAIHKKAYEAWMNSTEKLNNAYLIIQFPLERKFFLFKKVLKTLKNNNVKLVAVIHDLETLRSLRASDVSRIEKNWLYQQEIPLLREFDFIVSHNSKMTQYLVSLGMDKNKIVDLQIFDYLTDAAPNNRHDSNGRIVIAGNLAKQKAGYAYHLPENINFDLYGPNYEGVSANNIHYHGVVPSGQLPSIIEGKFGLIWDGDRPDTCNGVCGEYLKYNNPHKTSLYIASGLPIIIWKNAAMSDFIINNGLGFEIGSLQDISAILKDCSDKQYGEIKINVCNISSKLKNGYYLNTALNEIFSMNN